MEPDHHYIHSTESAPPHTVPVHPPSHHESLHLTPRIPAGLHDAHHTNALFDNNSEEQEENVTGPIAPFGSPHYDEITYDVPKEACWIDMHHRKVADPPCPPGTKAIYEPGMMYKSFACYKPCGAKMLHLGPYCTHKDLIIPRGFTIHSDTILDKPLFRLHYVGKDDKCGYGYKEGKIDQVGKKECHAECPKGFHDGGLNYD